MAEPITLHASATEAGRPLTHFWSTVVGAGRANEGLRADWQRHLAAVRSECGFEYVRFHGLLHDDMFVYTEREDGTPVLNFQYVDALFDALLDAGVRPFVELGFSPRALARETETVFWWGAHGAPPVDLDRWSFLVRSLVEHWVARYGLAEVRAWYFEVWNEANLRGFFRGTRSEYLALYAASARAVKAVDERLRVGGPATSNFVPDARFDGETEDFQVHEATLGADLDSLDWKPVWLEAFLDFCEREHLPVDFVSTHPYPTDWALDEHGQGARLTREVDATPRTSRSCAASWTRARSPTRRSTSPSGTRRRPRATSRTTRSPPPCTSSGPCSARSAPSTRSRTGRSPTSSRRVGRATRCSTAGSA